MTADGAASADLAWTITNELRSDLARHVLACDLSSHRRTSPGELVSRVDGDVTALSEFIASFVVKVVSAAVTLVGIVLVVTWQDWRLARGGARWSKRARWPCTSFASSSP